jgi:hypothetical protein
MHPQTRRTGANRPRRTRPTHGTTRARTVKRASVSESPLCLPDCPSRRAPRAEPSSPCALRCLCLRLHTTAARRVQQRLRHRLRQMRWRCRSEDPVLQPEVPDQRGPQWHPTLMVRRGPHRRTQVRQQLQPHRCAPGAKNDPSFPCLYFLPKNPSFITTGSGHIPGKVETDGVSLQGTVAFPDRKPTICDPKLRSLNIDAECGSAEDFWYYSPWRSPGRAPVTDACGTAGGMLPGQAQGSAGADYTETIHAKHGDLVRQKRDARFFAAVFLIQLKTAVNLPRQARDRT